MAEIKTASELSLKLKELNPGAVVLYKGCHPNIIFFGQRPEILNWPEGFTYDEETGKISGLSTPITAWPL